MQAPSAHSTNTMGSIDNKTHVLEMLCTLEDDEGVLDAVVEDYLTADASEAIGIATLALNDIWGPTDAPHAQILAAAEAIERLGVFATLQGRLFLLQLDGPSDDWFKSAVIRVLQLLALTQFVHTGTELTVVPTDFDVVCALDE
jgi:hypothetical protein